MKREDDRPLDPELAELLQRGRIIEKLSDDVRERALARARAVMMRARRR